MQQSFMKTRPVLPLVLSMSLPMVLSMMVTSLYNIVDSYYVARISEDAMTALSLVFPVQNLINAVTIGFSIGANAVISYHLGAQEAKKANAAASVQHAARRAAHGRLHCRHAGLFAAFYNGRTGRGYGRALFPRGVCVFGFCCRLMSMEKISRRSAA